MSRASPRRDEVSWAPFVGQGSKPLKKDTIMGTELVNASVT